MSDLTFDHVAIPITNAQRSRHFYSEVLGLPLVSAMSGDDWEGHPWLLMFFALRDGRMLALTTFAGVPAEQRSALPADARHYALATDDLEAWKHKLAQLEIAFREEDHTTQRSLFIEDPDHTVWEITSPASPNAFRADPSEARAVVARWIAEH